MTKKHIKNNGLKFINFSYYYYYCEKLSIFYIYYFILNMVYQFP